MSHKNENLERLLQQFVDQAQAGQMAEDIGYADTIFDTHPAPSLSQEAVVSLKHGVQRQLKYNRNSKIRWVRTAAIVAIGLMGAFVLYSNVEKNPGPSMSIVKNKLIGYEDFFSAEINTAEIEKEITALHDAVESFNAVPYEPVDTLQLDLKQIENELIADSAEFWKG